MHDAFISEVIRAAADARYGFVLDYPPDAVHPRNLPYSWSDGSILFGWEPVNVLTVHEGPEAANVAEDLRTFLAPLDAGGAAVAVGYLSYDLGGHFEPTALSRHDADVLPLVTFGLYETFFEYDTASRRVFVVENGLRRAAAAGELDAVHKRASASGSAVSGARGPTVSDFTRDAYMTAVAAAREYILAGDIFEVNISQRFRGSFDGEPWELYLLLRDHNPAPYAAFLSCPEASVLSSSPELFLRIDGKRIVTRPIKGTIARREGSADEKAVGELASSEKDNAELAMIIDLERNDLGRVSRYGSVRVAERARVETFRAVHHLVSTVEGRLAKSADLAGVIRATFPGGSITGAPKVRAMQIIDELEPCRRGVYTGSLGYVLPGGRAEFNIAIRTMVYDAGRVSLQVGGAVTADSDPAAEYAETLAKARAMMSALGLGADGL